MNPLGSVMFFESEPISLRARTPIKKCPLMKNKAKQFEKVEGP